MAAGSSAAAGGGGGSRFERREKKESGVAGVDLAKGQLCPCTKYKRKYIHVRVSNPPKGYAMAYFKACELVVACF